MADAPAAALSSPLVWEGSVGWTPECLPYTQGVLERYRTAGFHHVSLTVAAEWHGPAETLRHLGAVRRSLLARDDVSLVRSVPEILAARAAGKLAASFNIQGAGPYGGDPATVEPFAALGIRLAILAYNARNALGDGCQEPGDAGLSRLGERFVAECNRAGVLVDLSHMGARSALDAVEASWQPCVISHSNPRRAFRHVRNVRAGLIRACAAKGGVIGLNGLGFLLGADARATVPAFLDHVCIAADIAGPGHVALGMDWNFYDPFMRQMFAANPGMAAQGYPPPPWDSLPPESLGAVAEGLAARGWAEEDVAGLLGANMMRVASRVWR